MAKKRALSFPPWLEAAAILLLLVMAVVEYEHGQIIWAGIFGISGSLFAGSFAARLIAGGKQDGK
jgi:hypothetical protein